MAVTRVGMYDFACTCSAGYGERHAHDCGVRAPKQGFGWLRCNCASTPPTMPTCRAEHLKSCPMYVYAAVVKMEADSGALMDHPVPPGKVPADVAANGLHGAAAMTARAIRVLMEESGRA